MITLNAGPDNCYLCVSCVESRRFNLSSMLFLKSIKMFRTYSMCNIFLVRWPSGLRRSLGKRVYGNVPRVRIPLSPPKITVPSFLAGTTQGQQASETDQPLRSANSPQLLLT